MISKHITLAEATKSQTAQRLGIKNEPTPEHLENMKAIAEAIFEPLRKHFKVPIAITSFYRSAELNKAIKGSMTSQHLTGEAMDIDAQVLGKITNKQVFDWIKANCTFDQLLHEYGTENEPDWVHVSYTRSRPNRGQVLRAISGGKYISI
jgi:zinc D-Ala-D-Ala carboxypeptidase